MACLRFFRGMQNELPSAGLKAPLFLPLSMLCGGIALAHSHILLSVCIVPLFFLFRSISALRSLPILLSFFLLGFVLWRYTELTIPQVETEHIRSYACQSTSNVTVIGKTYHTAIHCSCSGIPRLVRYEIRSSQRIPAYARSVFWGVAKPFSTSGFDVKRWKRSQGIAARLHPLGPLTWNIQTPVPAVHRQWERSKSSLHTKLNAAFSVNLAGFLWALSTGDKSLLSAKIRHQFSESGIGHLLAVSGYHIGLVGFFPLLLFRMKHRLFRMTGMILLPAIWWYVGFCNWPISALRAVIMTTFYAIGQLIQRPVSGFQSWCFAGCLVLLLWPEASASLGAQLSFAAVAAILLFLHLNSDKSQRSRWLRAAGIPLAAQWGTMGWSIPTFGFFPLAFWPVNVLVAPWMTVVGGAYFTWIGLDSLLEIFPILIPLQIELQSFLELLWTGLNRGLILIDSCGLIAICTFHWWTGWWIFLTATWFAKSMLQIYVPSRLRLWKNLWVSGCLFFLPWAMPSVQPTDATAIIHARNPVLVFSNENGALGFISSPTSAEWKLHKKARSVGLSPISWLHLQPGQTLVTRCSWLHRTSAGWVGRIQNRPFQWFWTGDGNGVIEHAGRQQNWRSWQASTLLNSSEVN